MEKLTFLKKVMMSLIISMSCLAVYAQTTVSGTVTDDTGEPLIGVSIMVKGTTNGSITDFDGNFALSNVSAKDVLVFSYIGYGTKEITIGNQKVLKVVMSEDTKALDEVVVVGYGQMKKNDLTGSVSSVDNEMLTAKGTIDDKTSGFDNGADDYLVKPFDIQEVLLRIRVLLRRNQPQTQILCSTEILDVGEIEILPDTLEAVILNKKVKLTPTEFEILYCLMQHFNKAVTLATLLEEVWGYDSDEDVRMLRVHVGGLRNKIEPDTKNPKYLHTVTNVGYKLTPFGEN